VHQERGRPALIGKINLHSFWSNLGGTQRGRRGGGEGGEGGEEGGVCSKIFLVICNYKVYTVEGGGDIWHFHKATYQVYI
jgi:hypothetical protein